MGMEHPGAAHRTGSCGTGQERRLFGENGNTISWKAFFPGSAGSEENEESGFSAPKSSSSPEMRAVPLFSIPSAPSER